MHYYIYLFFFIQNYVIITVVESKLIDIYQNLIHIDKNFEQYKYLLVLI